MITDGGEGLDPKEKEETHDLSSLHLISHQIQHTKKKIMCKFFMMGNCLKNEKCEYLHSEDQNFPGFRGHANPPPECPMYELGFCKNGPMCKFKHERKSILEVEEISGEMRIENLPELPIWYLEHYFDKPIEVIFEEFEKQNSSVVNSLKEKYDIIPYNYSKKNQFQFMNIDIYAEKKDSILFQLSKKVRFFIIICKTKEEVKFSMDNNLLITNRSNSVKFKEAKRSSDNIVFIILDQETMDYSGFVNFRKEISDDEASLVLKSVNEDYRNIFIPSPGFVYLKIEWLWRTKLHYTKLDMLCNPLGNNEYFVQSKDGQEVSVDVGNYVCRMMIKRLSKEEVRVYMKNKRSSNTEGDDSNHSNHSNHHTRVEIKSFIEPIHNSKEDYINTGSQKVYVTNISNLQVNISHNTTVHPAMAVPSQDYINKTRHRTKSLSKKRTHSHKRKQSSGSRSPSKSSSSYYDSEATVKLEEKPKASKKNESGKSHVKSILVKPSNAIAKSSIISQLMQDHNKVYKNKLFSNAMEKIAESYLKQETGGKKM